MNKLAFFLLVCSTASLMAMESANSKLQNACKVPFEIETRVINGRCFREISTIDLMVLAKFKIFWLDELRKKFSKVSQMETSVELLVGMGTEEVRGLRALSANFNFISNNPTNNKAFEDIDVSLKLITDQGLQLYKNLREKKEGIDSIKSELNLPSVLYRYPSIVTVPTVAACAYVSNRVANYLSSKIFDKSAMPERNTIRSEIVHISLSLASRYSWTKLNSYLYGSGKKTKKTFLKHGAGLTLGSLFCKKALNKSYLANVFVKEGIAKFGDDALVECADKMFLSSYYKNCKDFEEKEVYEKNKKQFHALEVQALDLSRWAKTRKAYILKSLFKEGIREIEKNKVSNKEGCVKGNLLDVVIKTPYWSKDGRDNK